MVDGTRMAYAGSMLRRWPFRVSPTNAPIRAVLVLAERGDVLEPPPIERQRLECLNNLNDLNDNNRDKAHHRRF